MGTAERIVDRLATRLTKTGALDSRPGLAKTLIQRTATKVATLSVPDKYLKILECLEDIRRNNPRNFVVAYWRIQELREQGLLNLLEFQLEQTKDLPEGCGYALLIPTADAILSLKTCAQQLTSPNGSSMKMLESSPLSNEQIIQAISRIDEGDESGRADRVLGHLMARPEDLGEISIHARKRIILGSPRSVIFRINTVEVSFGEGDSISIEPIGMETMLTRTSSNI